jgi:hypothetical protein
MDIYKSRERGREDMSINTGISERRKSLALSGDTYHDYLIDNLVFNLTSDLMMLCIPAPILARSRLPIQKYVFPLCTTNLSASEPKFHGVHAKNVAIGRFSSAASSLLGYS